MELFILTVKPIENKYARTLIFFAYFCNKQIPYPVFFVKAPTLRRTASSMMPLACSSAFPILVFATFL